MRHIILLNGPPGSGKDEIANYLAENHGFIHRKMADPIVSCMSNLFEFFNDPVDDEHGYENFKRTVVGKDNDGNDVTGREFMIRFSEGFVKPILGDDIWIKKMLGHLFDPCGNNFYHPGVVISDVGFQNEVDAIRDAYPNITELWAVEKDGCTFNGDSRKSLDCPNRVITNNGSLDDLFRTIESTMS